MAFAKQHHQLVLNLKAVLVKVKVSNNDNKTCLCQYNR
jgi:hypothetical protein